MIEMDVMVEEVKGRGRVYREVVYREIGFYKFELVLISVSVFWVVMCEYYF